MGYKKFMLYLDKEKHSFREGSISEDELKQIEHGLIVQKRINQGILFSKTNPEKKFYILLNTVINNLRSGDPNKFDRVIYFIDNDEEKEKAKTIILNKIKKTMNGRDENSLQNLGFITEENLNFISSLKGEVDIKEMKKKKKEKNDD